MPTSSSHHDGEDNREPQDKSAWAGRRLLPVLAIAPVIGLVAILVWGAVQNSGAPGRPGVNDSLGEVGIQERPAPDFEITLLGSDESLALSDLRGKVVMVDFWSSWCPPCRQEAPMLAEVYRRYEGMPVEFVGVDIWDTEPAALEYLERYGITFPSGEDANGQIAIEYGLSGIPEKYFIDANGMIRRKFIGPMNRELLIELIDEYLRELELEQLKGLTPDT